MVRSSLLVVGFLLAHGAFAHTGLASSEPSAGATLAAPVAEIVLMFSGEVRLTAVVLTDGSDTEKALGAFAKETAARFVISVEEPLPPGEYTIMWRAVGADTHVVSGEIPFSVSSGPRGQ
jgi:methionine-rich copper-binding protein CopC